MSDWITRGRANAMAQDAALRRKWQGLASQSTSSVQMQTPKISPAKPAGEGKPAARPMDLIAAMPRSLHFGLSDELKTLAEDSIVKAAAQKELSYINSREYAHKQETQRKQAQQRADSIYQEMENYVANPNVDPLSDPKILEYRNQYNAAIANTKANDSLDFMQRNELEILAKGGKSLMNTVEDLAEARDRVQSRRTATSANIRETKDYFAQYKGLKAQYGDELDDWLAYADRVRNGEKAEDKLADWQQFGRDKNDFVTWNTSVATGLGKPLGTLDIAGQHIENLITGKDYPIDYNTPAQMPGMVSNAIRAGATEDKSGFGRFLYNSTASIADSLIPMVAAPGFGQYLLGLSSATDTIHAAAERGATDEEALLLGAIAGAAEVVTEKVQFDRIFGAKNADDLVKPIERIFRNAVPEGMEEGATTLATTVADLLITKDKSELATMVQRYEDMGYGKERAQALALRDWGKGLGVDFLGGAFSGAVLTGGVELYNKASVKRSNQRAPKAGQSDQQDFDRMFLQGFETAYGEDGTVQSKTDADRLSDTYNAYYFDRYKEVLKENAPQTLEEFSRIRYDNGEAWEQLQRQFEIVERYETRGTVPVDQVIELDQVAYRNKTDAFDYSAFHGDDRDFVKALAKSGNAAAMELDGKVYFSHSAVEIEGTLEFDAYGGEYPLIGLSEERIFTTFGLGDGIPREYDTEAKFLEYVAKVKKDTTEAFTVTILSEKHICESCESVVEQFRKRYPNATVNIISGNPNYGEANAKGEKGLKNWKYRKD